MTGQVLDRNSNGILVLIIPIAFAIVLICKLWPVLLGLTVLIVSWSAWQEYQWRKWSEEVNPYFNNLIADNRGYLTPMDLSVKANLTAKAAQAFLERKSAEYGTSPTNVKDKGVVYYFPTASALGRIFDDSDPFSDDSPEDQIDTATSQAPSDTSTIAKESNSASFKELTQLAKQEQAKTETNAAVSNATESESTNQGDGLNQAELAKRLDVNSSTVGRNKSKPESDFAMWSQSKDPEGVAWKYVAKSNEFVAKEAG